MFAKGWALFLTGHWHEALEILKKTKDLTIKLREKMFFGKTVQLLMMIHYAMDDHQRALELARSVEPLIPFDTMEAMLVQRSLAISLAQLGEMKEAQLIWDKIDRHPARHLDPAIDMETASLKAMNYSYLLGRMDEADQYLDKAIAFFRKSDHMGRLGRCLLFKANIEYNLGHYPLCLSINEQALREMKHNGHIAHIAPALAMEIVTALHLNKEEQALRTMSHLEGIFAEINAPLLWKEYSLFWARACMAIYNGHQNDFLREAGKVILSIEKIELWYDKYMVYSELAMGYAGFGKIDKCIDLLKTSLEDAERASSPFCTARIRLLLAGILYDRGDTIGAKKYLKHALILSKETNADDLFLHKERKWALKLLPLALDDNLHGEYATGFFIRLSVNNLSPVINLLKQKDAPFRNILIQALADFHCRDAEKYLITLTKDRDQKTQDLANRAIIRIQSLPPLPLRIVTLGRFRVNIENRQVPETVWKRRTAVSIFKYMVMHSGRDLAMEKLIDIFFPSTDLEKAKPQLHQAVSSIRKALEPGIAPKRQSSYIKAGDGIYRIVLPEQSSIDVLFFEKLYLRGIELIRSREYSAAFNQFNSALELYKGPFLESDTYQDWTQPIRENTELLYRGVLREIAAIHFRRGDYEACLYHIQTLLDKDPWDEQAVLQKMQCYYAIGDRPRIIKAYVQCRQILQDDLGIDPSPEVTKLYRQVVS